MKGRRGFSLIEILVVMGIILVLMGILFLGGRHVFGTSRTKATRVTLENLRGMVAEFDATTRQLGTINALYSVVPLTNPMAAPGDVSEYGAGRATPEFEATVAVMTALRTAPNNRRSIEQLPADQIEVFTVATVSAPLLLDGWGNPIIFVPDGGLMDVSVGGLADQTITSVKVVPNGTATPVGSRPFWASAGEDQNFSTGDDNIYSFEN